MFEYTIDFEVVKVLSRIESVIWDYNSVCLSICDLFFRTYAQLIKY